MVVKSVLLNDSVSFLAYSLDKTGNAAWAMVAPNKPIGTANKWLEKVNSVTDEYDTRDAKATPTVSLACSAIKPILRTLINLNTSFTPLLKKSKVNLYLKPSERTSGIWTRPCRIAPKITPSPKPVIP